jgi:transcriptional regulator with XRE-family HTH domain
VFHEPRGLIVALSHQATLMRERFIVILQLFLLPQRIPPADSSCIPEFGMPHEAGKSRKGSKGLTGHALRNANLRLRSLARSKTAPPLARAAVKIRAKTLGITRLEFARQSGVSRAALRDLELGFHTPTCLTMQRYVEFITRSKVPAEQIEELCQLYAGAPETVPDLIARYELRATSLRELARRAKLSACTLWEYRRGHFPVPLPLLKRLCRLVDEDETHAETVWQKTERRRLLDKGYPPAWAELSMWCGRAGRAESRLLSLGVKSNSYRRLCYFELPPWEEVAQAAEPLSRNPAELRELKQLWQKEVREQEQQPRQTFGAGLQQLREQQGRSRRELADLFRIGGKKPARIIKHIEEDGMYSMQAFPAGLAALLTPDKAEQSRLLNLWCDHRRHFHCRRRPETRVDLRLARELYGFEIPQTAKFLGYTNLEYQKVERGIEQLMDSAKDRILTAIHHFGELRLQELFQYQRDCETARQAWKNPSSVSELVQRLAQREGGTIPLARRLRQAGLDKTWTRRLHAIAHSLEVPTWPELKQIARVGEVSNLSEVRRDWATRYRNLLISKGHPPLATELRLLIAEVAPTLREFCSRMPFGYAVLIRDMNRIDKQHPLRWFHIERILTAAGLPSESDRWQKIETLWQSLDPRQRIRQR